MCRVKRETEDRAIAGYREKIQRDPEVARSVQGRAKLSRDPSYHNADPGGSAGVLPEDWTGALDNTGRTFEDQGFRRPGLGSFAPADGAEVSR